MKIEGRHYRTVWFRDGELNLIDQTLLPGELTLRDCATIADLAEAIAIAADRSRIGGGSGTQPLMEQDPRGDEAQRTHTQARHAGDRLHPLPGGAAAGPGRPPAAPPSPPASLRVPACSKNRCTNG